MSAIDPTGEFKKLAELLEARCREASHDRRILRSDRLKGRVDGEDAAASMIRLVLETGRAPVQR